MALDIFPLSGEDTVCEVLLREEPGEDPQHVGLVIVPFQTILLELSTAHLPQD